MERENRSRLTLGIMLTALFYGWDAPTKAPYLEYSDHSSYSEINEFVRAVKPKIVNPIVSSVAGSGMMREWANFLIRRIDMSPLKHHLSKIPPKYFSKPAELKNDIAEVPEVALIKNCSRKRKRLQNN